MSGTQFMSLPSELLIEILSLLSGKDLFFSVQLTNHYLRSLIQATSGLQYLIEIYFAGFEDNIMSNAPYADRLDALRRSEHAWTHLIPARTSVLSIRHAPSGLYDLSAGVYVLGERADTERKSTAVRYTYLSIDQGNEPWLKIDVGHQILDFGLAVREHDLIALVTLKLKTDDLSGTRVVELVLLHLSTGKNHPAAKEPVIVVREQSRHQLQPSVMLEIVGDNLVLLLSHAPERGNVDALYVYDWRSGRLKASMFPPLPCYQGFVFLREDVLLIPNTVDRRLEMYTIGEHSLIPQCFLDLPDLAFHHFIWQFSCRAEPNPVGANSSSKSNDDPEEPAFLSTPDDAIVVFKIALAAEAGMSTCSFIAHRSSLLEWLPETPYSSKEFQSVDQYGGVGRITISAETIPWENWGPSRTRWFSGNDIAGGYITVTAGQRFVTIDADADEDPAPLTARDFNAHNIARYNTPPRDREDVETAEPEAYPDDDSDSDGSAPQPTPGRRLIKHATMLQPRSVFSRDYWSELPYIETVSESKHNYAAVLMDEDRILGLRLLHDIYETTRELEVLHMR